MTIEEIVRGESKTVEFKVMLPRDSEKYIKTIVAFANSQGGQLIVGVDDRTQQMLWGKWGLWSHGERESAEL